MIEYNNHHSNRQTFRHLYSISEVRTQIRGKESLWLQIGVEKLQKTTTKNTNGREQSVRIQLLNRILQKGRIQNGRMHQLLLPTGRNLMSEYNISKRNTAGRLNSQ
jgi:hypothetical protein